MEASGAPTVLMAAASSWELLGTGRKPVWKVGNSLGVVCEVTRLINRKGIIVNYAGFVENIKFNTC